MRVISRTLELVKRPKAKNLPQRRVSISPSEADEVYEEDILILKVMNGKEEVATRVYTGAEFHLMLHGRVKVSKSGDKIHYFTLSY
jgi:hypothetical protein